MFGYIRPFQPNLRVCEWEAYRGAYCGLCRTLGKEYGWRFRLILSYDGAFIVMLSAALSDRTMCLEKKSCTCNPLKKCPYLCNADACLSYAAAVTVLLTRYKLLDDAEDEKGFARLKAKFFLWLMRKGWKKAKKGYPVLAQGLQDAMKKQQELETELGTSLDACSEPTGMMLCAIFREISTDATQRRILENMGYQFGRWAYLMDASDDLAEDIRTGKFNPLAIKFSLHSGASENALRAAREYANGVLNMDAAQINAAWALLKGTHYVGVLQNILTQGLAAAQKQVLEQKKQKNISLPLD